MKKVIFCVVAIALALGSGLVVAHFIQNKNVSADTTTAAKDNGDFAWGIHLPLYLKDYNSKNAQKELNLVDELGANTVRFNLATTVKLDPFSASYDEKSNDDFISQASEHGKDICLIIDGDIIGSTQVKGFDYEAAGYQMGAYAAKRYKGTVKYYQLANEVTGTIVKPDDPNFNGPVFDGLYGLQYSTDRYNAVLGWLKGMQAGVRDNDPNAKIVITGHWILYDVIAKLHQDGINFDILGWAWYSADGDDMTKRDIGQGKTINLVDKLAEFGKPIWIIELNTARGSYNNGQLVAGEQMQANWIKKSVQNLLKNKQITGIFFFTLVDAPYATAEEAHWGMAQVGYDSTGQVQFTKKKVFDVFKDLIKKN
jgi:hypothetical protein